MEGQKRDGMAVGSAGRVTQTSMPGNGKAKPSGSTPTIVCGVVSSVAALPPIVGSPPKRPFQSRALIMATGAAPGESSAGRNPRPTTGRTPSMSRKLPETRATLSASGSPAPERVTFSGTRRKAPIPSNDRAVALMSSNRPSENGPSCTLRCGLSSVIDTRRPGS